MALRPRPVVAMLIVLGLLAALPVSAALPTVHVTYHAALADGAFPASLVAKATVTSMSVADPAILNRSQTAAYDPATGTATWTLPANCQAYFECLSTPLSGVYSVGAVDLLLNSVIPVSAPSEMPAWAAGLVPSTGTTQDLDLGAYDLSALTVNLNQTLAPTSSGVTVTPTTGGALTGSYGWNMSYVTATGETEAGYIGAATLAGQAALLSGLPIGGAGVTARKLYRNASGPYYPPLLVATLDNVTTAYTDSLADGSLGAQSLPQNTTGGWISVAGEPVFQADHSGIRIGPNQIWGGLSGTNIGIGDSVGPQPGTAHDEVFIGNGAGRYVRNGAGDVAIGAGALSNSTNVPDDSHRRTAIGTNALFGAPGSDNTVAIGDFAGIYATGKHGLYLGSQRGMNETRDGWLHIGNDLQDIIYGDMMHGLLYVSGSLGVSGNITAPNISGTNTGDQDLGPYAQKAVSNNWSALQTFDKGVQVGGSAASDVAPTSTTISGQGAFPNASTNRTGGDLTLSGGPGQTAFTVVDWATLYGGAVSIYVDEDLPTSATYMLTEGVEYSAQTSNAVTAVNLAAAVNAWVPGVYATAYGAVVALEKASGATNFRPESLITQITATTNLPGTGYLSGPWIMTTSLALNGETMLPWAVWSHNPDERVINATGKSFMVLAEHTPWSPDGITGTADGKTLLLAFQDANITIADAAPFDLSAAFTSSAGAALQLIWNGTAWRELWRSPVVVPAETDGVVGNEVTNATNATLTRSGAGTAVDPYTLGLNLGNANTWTAAQTFNGTGNWTTPQVLFGTDTTKGFSSPATNLLAFIANGGTTVKLLNTGIVVGSGQYGAECFLDLSTGSRLASARIVGWSADTFATDALDTSLSRSAAGVLQVGDGAANANGKVLAAQYRLAALNTAPSSATDTGILGEIRVTATYIYICTATNTWVRAALATW